MHRTYRLSLSFCLPLSFREGRASTHINFMMTYLLQYHCVSRRHPENLDVRQGMQCFLACSFFLKREESYCIILLTSLVSSRATNQERVLFWAWNLWFLISYRACLKYILQFSWSDSVAPNLFGLGSHSSLSQASRICPYMLAVACTPRKLFQRYLRASLY